MAIKRIFSIDELPVQATTPGARAFATWAAGKSTRWLLVTISALYVCTVAITSVNGIGSIVQCFTEMGILENGTAVTWDPRLMLAASESLRQQLGTKTRLTTTGTTGGITLQETFKVPFEYMMGGNPGETRYRERVIAQPTQLFYTLNAANNGIAALVQIGAGAATIGTTAAGNGFTITCEQYYDNTPPQQLLGKDKTGNPIFGPGGKTPLFKPTWTLANQPVTGANINLAMNLTFQNVIRGMTILQDTNIGMVHDIINSFQFRGSRSVLIGETGVILLPAYGRGKEWEYAGDVFVSETGGVIHINFQESGRIAKCINPYQDTGWQLIFNCQPSVTSGATSSTIIVLQHELKRDTFQRLDNSFVTAVDAQFTGSAKSLLAAPAANS